MKKKCKGVGYAFDCKQDVNGQLGLMENYKILDKGDVAQLEILTCVTQTYTATHPYYMDVVKGFIPLETIGDANASLEDRIQQFISSHKPMFTRLKDMLVVVDATIVFNKETLEINREKSKIDLFMPNRLVKEMGLLTGTDAKNPAILCKLITAQDSSAMTDHLTDVTIEAIKASVYNAIDIAQSGSRFNYTMYRIKNS